MTFAITAAHDNLYDNVVIISYSGFTDTSGSITFGDGTSATIFPPAGQVTHQYTATGSFTATGLDSGSNSLGTVGVTVSAVTTRSADELYSRSNYHVQPTSITSTNGAYEAAMPASTDNALLAMVAGDTQQRLKVDAAGKHTWGSGALAGDTTLYRAAADVLATDDDLAIKTAGKGLQIKQGSNAKCGVATLNGTTEVVVSTTAVTANSIILLGGNAPAGTPATAYVSTVTAGTSFGVKSAASNTSVIGWMIVEPA